MLGVWQCTGPEGLPARAKALGLAELAVLREMGLSLPVLCSYRTADGNSDPKDVDSCSPKPHTLGNYVAPVLQSQSC